MNLAVIRCWLCASVWALVVTGCFTDVPADGPMMIGQTEGGGCVEGASGCPCYGNDTCDPGLTCAKGPNVCVPTGCQPGTAACVCDDGFVCDNGLECEGSVCVVPGESTSSDPTMSTSTPSTSTTIDDDDSTTVSVVTESETSETASTTLMQETSTTTDTGEPVDCGMLGCQGCAACVLEDDQPCAAVGQTCAGLEGCPTVAACLANCTFIGVCDDCCEGAAPNVVAAALAVDSCRSDQCFGACGEWEDPTCTQ